MCLILLAYGVHPRYPLLVAANRDEFHTRPTASSHVWQVPGGILAGRDLEAGGTWLGVNSVGGFAAITNVSENAEDGDWLSRGNLVAQFLGQEISATAFAAGIDGTRYRGFNLLLWDGSTLIYTSNRGHSQALRPGIYGIANAGLDENRFKVRRGTDAMAVAIDSATADSTLAGSLFSLLSDCTPPTTPERRGVKGMSEDMQQALGACFIQGDVYGTRASTVVMLNGSQCDFSERLYAPRGLLAGQSNHRLTLEQVHTDGLYSTR